MLNNDIFDIFFNDLFGIYQNNAYLCNIKLKVKLRKPAATGNSGTKDMTTIYNITEWNNNMEQTNSKLFMTLDGVAKWLAKQSPIDNQINVRDRENAGAYDITADNLRTILTASQQQGWVACFSIQQDFVLQVIETHYTLSTVSVED